MHSGDVHGSSRPYGSFSDSSELERLVERSESIETKPLTVFDRLARAKASFNGITKKCEFIFTNDSAHENKKEVPRVKMAALRRQLRNARKGFGQRAQRLGQRIKQIIRPLEMLQFVAALFLNVAHGLTNNVASSESFSVPRFLMAMGKAAATTTMVERWLGPFSDAGKGSVEKGGKSDKNSKRSGGRRKFFKGDRHGDGGDDKIGPISPAKLKEGLKNAKRWMGGMRRSFSSSEDLKRDTCRKVEYHVKEGVRLNSICDSEGAVDMFRQAVALRPHDVDLLVCLSKSLSDRVFHEDVFHNHALARELSKEAARISELAISIKPTHAEAHLSLGAALGRLSMWSDNREKVELSKAIKERCEDAIRLDPSSDLAMHVLGRYEHQMAMLGRIVRLLVRAVYGGSLSPGTTENAEALFRRAIAINGTRLIHRVELGKLLLDMNRKPEALTELQLAVTLPREDVNSEFERRDACELLLKHWGIVVVCPTFTDPPVTPLPKQQKRRSFEGMLSPRRSIDGGARRSIDSGSPQFEGDSARGSPVDGLDLGRGSLGDSARGSPG